MPFRVGQRVVPISKSGGFHHEGLADSVEWHQAQERNQPFLYVNHIKPNGTIVCFHFISDVPSGDFFKEKDLIPYEEEVPENKNYTYLLNKE